MRTQPYIRCIGAIVASVMWTTLLHAQCTLNEFDVVTVTPTPSVYGDHFGAGIAIADGCLFVGSPYARAVSSTCAGRAHVFDGSDGLWQEQLLPASGHDWGDRLGHATAIDGDRALVSALEHGSGCAASPNGTGKVYIYQRDDTTWSEQQLLLASDGESGDDFGCALHFAGDRMVVGACNNDGTGSVYVFRENPSDTWSEVADLTPSDGVSYDDFGAAVDRVGDLLVVGAPYRNNHTGAVYLFRDLGMDAWVEEFTLVAADGNIDDEFGHAVATDGTTIWVGAPGYSLAGNDRGRVYAYQRAPSGDWIEVDTIVASELNDGDEFGASLLTQGTRLLVGAPGNLGRVTLFEWNGIAAEEGTHLVASDAASGDEFGATLALEADLAVVGAPRHDGDGMVYLFDLASCPPPFRRGDCIDDGVRDITDVIGTLNGLFGTGPTGTCGDACDSNDDGSDDISDAVYLLAYLFQFAAPPPAPFDCGTDPTEDATSCESYAACP